MRYDKCELLGFDIRLCPEDYVEALWDRKMRDIHLLSPEINWPLSVDTMIWPSLFRYFRDCSIHSYFQFNEAIDVTPRNTRHSALELWSSLDEMKNYYLGQKDMAPKNGISIAIILLLRDKSLQSDEFWNTVLDPPLSIDALPKNWLFLGYDVADRDMISGLSNCGYDPNEKNLLQKTWSARLNEYGLLITLEDAVEFQKVSENRVPEHKPFYVYALWRAPDMMP